MLGQYKRNTLRKPRDTDKIWKSNDLYCACVWERENWADSAHVSLLIINRQAWSAEKTTAAREGWKKIIIKKISHLCPLPRSSFRSSRLPACWANRRVAPSGGGRRERTRWARGSAETQWVTSVRLFTSHLLRFRNQMTSFKTFTARLSNSTQWPFVSTTQTRQLLFFPKINK